eukprot:3062939-Pleurochrysis_carterae.AAC.1
MSLATAAVTRSSPTTSSTRLCRSLSMRCRATTTAAGTAPSPASVPTYLSLPKIAAHAASP